MSNADQLLSARISGICSRYCARGRIEAPDTAVAELRQVAGGRPDLLAAHAGARTRPKLNPITLERPGTGRRLNWRDSPEPMRRRSSVGSKSDVSELNKRG